MMKQSWLRNWFGRPITSPIRNDARRARLNVETLEDRAVPATFTVLNSNDTGAGSLRQAVSDANANVGADSIVFGDGSGGGGTNFLDATPDLITLTSGAITFAGDTALTTVTGPGANLLTVSGGNTQRIFWVNTGISTSISDMKLTGGMVNGTLVTPASAGAAVFNDGILDLANVIVTGNNANGGGGGGYGGAVHSQGDTTLINCTITGNTGTGLNSGNGSGTLTVSNTTISNNTLRGLQVGGGRARITDTAITGNLQQGVNAYVTILAMTNCTVSGNSYNGDGAGVSVGLGASSLTNCTITGNTALGNGGGMSLRGTTTLTNCTITGNTAARGGGFDVFSGTPTFVNTIVAGNTATNAPDVGGTTNPQAFTSLGHNLIGKTNGSTGWIGTDLTGTIASPLSAQLGALANNGGQTQTMAPLSGSPAIDAGISAISEVQDVALHGTTGTFTVTFNGQTTSSLAIGATAGTMQTALNALSSIGGVSGSVSVTKFNNVFRVTFGGSLANQNLAQMTAVGASGATPTVITLVNGNTDQRGLTRFGNTDIGAFEHQFKVTTTADTGIGSLRQAVANANAAVTADTVVFSTIFNSAQSITLNSGTITLTDAAGLTINGPSASLSIAGNAITNDAPLAFNTVGNLSVNTDINGAGSLTTLGVGTLTLTGANTYSGTTTIIAGTLQVGNGGTTGTLGIGALTNNGALAFNRSDTITIAYLISGSGALIQSGIGTTILTAANSYTGTTTISAGTLQVGNGGTTGSLGTGAVVNNATLSYLRSDSINVTNAISGSGTLNLTSTGGAITQSAPITVATLNANAATGITLTHAGNAFAHFTGLTATGGIDVVTASGLTVHAATAAGNIAFTTIDSAAIGQDLTIVGDITSASGSILLRGGDNVTVQPAVTLQAAGTITVYGDYGNADPGVGTTVTVASTPLTSPTDIAIFGNMDDDTFDVSAWTGTATVDGVDNAPNANEVLGGNVIGFSIVDLITTLLHRIAGFGDITQRNVNRIDLTIPDFTDRSINAAALTQDLTIHDPGNGNVTLILGSGTNFVEKEAPAGGGSTGTTHEYIAGAGTTTFDIGPGSDVIINTSFSTSAANNVLKFTKAKASVSFDVSLLNTTQTVDGSGNTVKIIDSLNRIIPTVVGSPFADTLSNSGSYAGVLTLDGGGGDDTITNTGSNITTLRATTFASFTNTGSNIAIDVSGTNAETFTSTSTAFSVNATGTSFSDGFTAQSANFSFVATEANFQQASFSVNTAGTTFSALRFDGDEVTFDGDEIIFDGDETVFGARLLTFDGDEIIFDGDEITFDGDEITFSVSSIRFDGDETTFQSVHFDGDETTFTGSSIRFDGDEVTFDGDEIVFDGDEIIFDGDEVTFNNSVRFDGDEITFTNADLLFDGDEVTFNAAVVFDGDEITFDGDEITFNASALFDGDEVTFNGLASFHAFTQFKALTKIDAITGLEVRSITVHATGTQFGATTLFDGDEVIFDGDEVTFSGTTLFGQLSIIGNTITSTHAKSLYFDGDEITFDGDETIFDGDEIIFDGDEILFDGDEVIFDGDEITFTNADLLFDGDEVIFNANVYFDGDEITFDGDEITFNGLTQFSGAIPIGTTLQSLTVHANRAQFGTTTLFDGDEIIFDGDEVTFNGATVYGQLSFDGDEIVFGRADSIQFDGDEVTFKGITQFDGDEIIFDGDEVTFEDSVKFDGDEVIFHGSGAVFGGALSLFDGDEIIFDGDEITFTGLAGFLATQHATIAAPGATFNLVSFQGTNFNVNLSNATIQQMQTTGDLFQLNLAGAHFDQAFLSASHATINAVGAEFGDVTNTSAATASTIDVSGATFTSLTNDAEYVTLIKADGATFGRLANTANHVTNILAQNADFQVIENSGSNIQLIRAWGSAAANSMINSGNDVTNIDFQGRAGNDSFVNTGNRVTGAFLGEAGDDSALISGIGLNLTLDGGTGNDTFRFTGAPEGNIILANSTGNALNDWDSLDFASLNTTDINGTPTGVSLDLTNTAVAQAVNAELDLQVWAGIKNVTGTAGKDTIIGNSLDNTILGAGLPDERITSFSNWNGRTQVVYLDFDTYTNKESQSITVNADQGTFTASFNSVSSGPLPFNISAAQLQAALESLSTIGVGNVAVELANGVLIVHFQNALAGLDVPTLIVDGANLLKGTLPGSVAVLTIDRGRTNEHVYTTVEREAIQARMESIYAGFHVFITQDRQQAYDYSLTHGGNGVYAPIYFNRPRIDATDGSEHPGGQSDELDFRNRSFGGTLVIQVNGLLNPADEPALWWVNASANIAIHEIAHMLGVRHADAFGPIGMGINNPPGADVYADPYSGLASAFETNLHIIISPAATGSDLLDEANDLYFGEREAIRLAMAFYAPQAADGQLIVAEQSSAHSTVVNAQALEMVGLHVPNTLHEGAINHGKQFYVAAVNVMGSMTSYQEIDYYSFDGLAGDLINMEVISDAIIRAGVETQAINAKLEVFDEDGNLIASNDNQFESIDAQIIDLRLPTSGTYFVKITNSGVNEDGAALPPLAYYEFFLYRFTAANVPTAGDYIDGGIGSDTLKGVASYANQLIGGSGIDIIAGSEFDGTYDSVVVNVNAGSTPSPLVEGAAFSGSVSITNLGGTSWTATVDYGDGTPIETLLLSVPSFSLSHPYRADNGTYNIAITVTNDDGVVGTASWHLDITNVAPTPSIDSISAIRQEGTAINVVGNATDPAGANDTLTYVWTALKNGAAYATASGVNLNNWAFTPNDNGSYDVRLTVSDEDGGSANAISQTMNVTNVAPASVVLMPTPLDANRVTTLAGTFTDPGALDTHTVVISWGDGTPDSTVSLAAGVLTFSITHQYVNNPTNGADAFVITATVIDKDNESGSGVASVLVGTLIGKDNQANTFYITGHNQVQLDGITYEGVKKLIGGNQNDTFIFLPNGNIDETIDGAAGVNTLDYSALLTNVSVNLTAGTASKTAGVTQIRDLIGGAGNDTLIGDTQDNVITGNAGSDILDGGLGNDTYRLGHGGDDVIHDLGGNDWLDFSTAAAGVNVNLRLNNGEKRYILNDHNDDSDEEHDRYDDECHDNELNNSHNTLAIYGAIENVVGSSFDDRITGTDAANVIHALGGNNKVWAGDGNDIITAGVNGVAASAVNRIHAGQGNDAITIYGNGNNRVRADGGGDTIFIHGNGANSVLGGGGNNSIAITGNGNNHITTGNGDDVIAIIGNGANTIDSGNGNDLITVVGAGANQITAGAGNDVVYGGAGNDNINGGAGDDILVGGDGNDILVGGEGNDMLVGGNGSDSLQGGAGHDVIIASTANVSTEALAASLARWVAEAVNRDATNTDDAEFVLVESDNPNDLMVDTATGNGGANLFILGANDRVTDFITRGSVTTTDAEGNQVQEGRNGDVVIWLS